MSTTITTTTISPISPIAPHLGVTVCQTIQAFPFRFRDHAFMYPSHRMKSQVLAAGVALLIGYFISYVIIFLVDTLGFFSRGRSDPGRRMRDYVTRHLYVFGIACMLSICAIPGLYGTFHAIFAWITVLIIIAMYIVQLIPTSDPNGIIRTIPLVLYYVSTFIWYIGIVCYYFKAHQYWTVCRTS